jgi:hypothetical protein
LFFLYCSWSCLSCHLNWFMFCLCYKHDSALQLLVFQGFNWLCCNVDVVMQSLVLHY